MKTHPVYVEVQYTSGRTESMTIHKDWPMQRKALEDLIRHGAVNVFKFRQRHERFPTAIGKEAVL